MPCTWQGGHFITKCIALSCSDRGLVQYALRFSKVLPECCSGHSYPISLFTTSAWPGSVFVLYKVTCQKVVTNRLTWRNLEKGCRDASDVISRTISLCSIDAELLLLFHGAQLIKMLSAVYIQLYVARKSFIFFFHFFNSCFMSKCKPMGYDRRSKDY